MKKDRLFLIFFLIILTVVVSIYTKAKEPVITSVRWYNDVRIGDIDSVDIVALDVDTTTGNLFAALRYRDSNIRVGVYISADTGKTWLRTYSWSGNTVDIDGAVLGNYFYVSYVGNDTLALMRRFSTSDGIFDEDYDDLSSIVIPGVVRVFKTEYNIKDIALASSQDGSFETLYYFAIMEYGLLGCSRSMSSGDQRFWSPDNPYDATNADRGLDACFNAGFSTDGEIIWCSYIGTNDSVYVASRSNAGWTYYAPFDHCGDVSSSVTSICAYKDTVMVIYSRLFSGNFAVSSRVSYDGGSNWTDGGELYGPSTNACGPNDITARKGDGFGAIYQTSGSGDKCVFTHRDYSTSWGTEVSISDSLVSSVKPAIERITDGVYGVIYVDKLKGGAWFDRSDWESGIEENPPGEILLSAIPALFSSQTSIEYVLPAQQNISLDVYDVSGSHVKKLASGNIPAGSYSTSWDGKDYSGNPVANGMYFCVLETNEKNSTSTKITLIK